MALIKVSQAMGSTPNIIDGGNATAITINSSEEVTFAAKITAVGTSIFTDLDISGDIDVDGTANLDAVDIDGALTQDGGAVFNEASADVDFRVESNGNANMLFVDGGNNKIGIGTNAGDGTLHVHTATAGTVAASTQADDVVIENSAEGGMTIITPNDQSARIRFTSPATNNEVGGAHIFYRQNINKMQVGTAVSGGVLSLASGASNETMLLDASGNVLVGKDTTALATAGLTLGAAGFASLTRSGATALNINRLTNDGDWITAYKAGTALGHIGTYGGTAYIGSANSGIMFNGVDIEPTSGEQTRLDNGVDLGSADYRFRDIVLGGGVFMGGTASANHLHDYEEGTWVPTIAAASGNAVTGTTVNQAVYTKIGRHVTIHTYISAINMALMTSGSYVQLQGLPFAASAYADFQFIYHRGGNTFVGGYIQSGTSYMYFCDVNGTEVQQPGNALLTAFIATASYITNA